MAWLVEPVSGSYKKTDDGKLNAVTVHFGVKSGEKPKKGKLKQLILRNFPEFKAGGNARLFYCRFHQPVRLLVFGCGV